MLELVREDQTYDGDPVHEVRVVAEVGDEVGCNTHHDKRADPVQNMVRSNERAVYLV
jgi:hypothetical protein